MISIYRPWPYEGIILYIYIYVGELSISDVLLPYGIFIYPMALPAVCIIHRLINKSRAYLFV